VSAADVRLLARGDWPAGRLHATWTVSSHRLDAAQRAAVDAAWAAAGARPGVSLFDGPMCRLESFRVATDGLHLQLSPTSYKAFIGTNGSNAAWADAHGAGVLANPVGTSAAVLSSDGHLVFGRRSQRVALYPGCAHPFGGTLEPRAGGAPDLLDEMRRELEEEIGLDRSVLRDLRAIALAEDRSLRQPELIYRALTTLDRAAIIARLEPTEHDACWTVPADPGSIAVALASPEPMTPVTRMTLEAFAAAARASA
jgi:8-oxo-dGTP pyrophosphatase MutT (NUDIX family)